MAPQGVRRNRSFRSLLLATAVLSAVAACGPQAISKTKGGPYAPGVDLSKQAVDGAEVGHRLMRAQQYELALEAFTRAALDQGLTPEILNGMGSANLGLGRLGQSEELLRRTVKAAPEWAGAWNNLGVVLMERGKFNEAEQIFRKAYALDNGQSDSIRDNLRFALANLENTDNTTGQNEDFKLVRQGSSEFLIRKTP